MVARESSIVPGEQPTDAESDRTPSGESRRADGESPRGLSARDAGEAPPVILSSGPSRTDKE